MRCNRGQESTMSCVFAKLRTKIINDRKTYDLVCSSNSPSEEDSAEYENRRCKNEYHDTTNVIEINDEPQDSGIAFAPGEDFQFTCQTDSYDYSASTEDNYACDKCEFVGKYGSLRSRLDYSFHRHYQTSRQLLHDTLIDSFLGTTVHDGDRVCSKPTENWLVFTAGSMGAGKGHTLHWLDSQGLFPLSAFILVDPDKLRTLLPETTGYIARDALTAGYLTQKEVGYISEVLTLHGLINGQNVLVDGSLRDSAWYLKYVQALHEEFPVLKIGIIHVTASPSTILHRIQKRAEATGRVVPENVILDTLRRTPLSIRSLLPFVDVFVGFENEKSAPEEPILTHFWLRKCDLDGIRVVSGDRRRSILENISRHSSASKDSDLSSLESSSMNGENWAGSRISNETSMELEQRDGVTNGKRTAEAEAIDDEHVQDYDISVSRRLNACLESKRCSRICDDPSNSESARQSTEDKYPSNDYLEEPGKGHYHLAVPEDNIWWRGRFASLWSMHCEASPRSDDQKEGTASDTTSNAAHLKSFVAKCY